MKPLKPIFYASVMTSNRGDMAIRESITSAIKDRLDVPFAYSNVKDKLTEQRIEQLNNDGSSLFIAGSGLYSNANTPSGWYFNCKPELFSEIKVPIFLIGLGCNNNLGLDIFGGELSDKAKYSIKLINNLVTISTVRDQRTFDILKDIDINNHELQLDPACFLEVPKIKKEKRVAINLAQHSPALGRFDGTPKERIKNIKLFGKIGRYLESKEYKIVFIAHDALEHSLIMDLQKELPDMEFVNTDNIDEMLNEYARCEFSIGVKMHSNIMSFASGTPFISLYYDVKSMEYLKLIHWSEFGHSVFSNYYNWLKKKVDNMIENHNYYIKQFRKMKKIEERDFDKLIEEICNIIEISN